MDISKAGDSPLHRASGPSTRTIVEKVSTIPILPEEEAISAAAVLPSQPGVEALLKREAAEEGAIEEEAVAAAAAGKLPHLGPCVTMHSCSPQQRSAVSCQINGCWVLDSIDGDNPDEEADEESDEEERGAAEDDGDDEAALSNPCIWTRTLMTSNGVVRSEVSTEPMHADISRMDTDGNAP